MPLFFFGVVLVVGLYLLSRGFLGIDPRALAQGIRYGVVGVGAVVFLFLAVKGEVGPALMLGALLTPLAASLRRRGKGRAHPTAEQASQVETLYLCMRLDHDSGGMTGTVLYGSFKGRALDTLTPAEMTSLLEECRNRDAPSVAVLEAWLDRTHPDWRARFAASGDAPPDAHDPNSPTREEAYEILGLSKGASAEQIREAHRRLMMGVHPDLGGSTYLAAKINQAKDLLLRG